MQSILGVFPLRFHGDRGSLGGGQHHQVQDAFAVGALAILFNADLAPETTGRLDEGGGRPGMQTEFVFDLEGFGDHVFPE